MKIRSSTHLTAPIYGLYFRIAKEFAGLGSSYCHNSTISSGQRVGKIVGNRGFGLPRVPSWMEGSRLEWLAQLVDHLVPALRGPFEIRSRRHPCVLQCDFRLALPFLEGQRDEHFQREVRAHAVIRRRHHVSLLVCEAVRVDNPLPGDDFTVHTGAPVVLALGRPHAVPEDASDPQVDGDEGGRESLRAPPLLHLTRVREGFPHAFGRCVEDPRDDEPVLLSTTSRLLFLRPRAALLRCLHQFGEALDRLTCPFLHPRGEHPLEVLARREDGLLRDLRLAPDLLEHGALDEDRSRPPLEFEGFLDSFERHDFPVLPVETELVPLGVPLDESPGPARSDVHLLHDRVVFPRPPPTRDQLRIRPRLPHQLARRIEDVRAHELSFRRSLRFTYCGHVFVPPFVLSCGFPPGVRPIERNGPPIGRGSASANRTPR